MNVSLSVKENGDLLMDVDIWALVLSYIYFGVFFEVGVSGLVLKVDGKEIPFPDSLCSEKGCCQ